MFGSSSTTSTFGFWTPSAIGSLAAHWSRMGSAVHCARFQQPAMREPVSPVAYPVKVRHTLVQARQIPCCGTEGAIGRTADLCVAPFLAAALRVKLVTRHPK